MSRKLFLNYAVKDLARAKMFWEKLGFSFNPMFSNDEAACLVLSDHNFVMIHTSDSLKKYISLPLSDPHQVTEVTIAIDCATREEVDTMVDKAVELGSTIPVPATDHGFMYIRTFKDPDGHHWEVFWMNPDFKGSGQ